jgi:pantoate--beta-alanine ligase
MVVIRTTGEARGACDAARAAGRSVGLVPTMGALHAGHASLLRRAADECDVVVATIFVNPLQFGDAADLAAYPRNEGADLAAAERLGVEVAFAPPVEEMFPAGKPDVTVDPGRLGSRLEGAARPGHFRGVATVVARLFAVVGRSRAYFGEKDAQQLALVRLLVRDLGHPVDIVACPTVREPDGLALSSRNVRLGAAERESATCLFLALTEAAELARSGERDAAVLVAAMAREIGATPLARLDYAAVVDDESFEEIRELHEGRPARALVAATFGATRLIDNVRLPRSPDVREDGAERPP